MTLAPDDTGRPSGTYDLTKSEWVRAPRQARSEETLVRFLDATAELLGERPFAEISVNDIVERAGRTVGSFYARFDDKSCVLRVLVGQVASRLRSDAAGFWSVERWRGHLVDEIVTGTVDAVLGAYRESGPVFHAAAIEAPGDPGFRDDRLSVWVVCAESFGQVLADHAGELDHPDPVHAGHLAMMAVIALADARLIYRSALPPAYASESELEADLVEVVRSIIRPRR